MVDKSVIEKARSNLLDFTLFTFPGYTLNWHHRLICEKLDKVINGEIKRLMIFMPPQHGKTELASRRFPAYVFGKKPDINIVACSHTADYSARINRDLQRIIDNDLYRLVFPDIMLSGTNVRTNSFGNWVRTSTMFEIVNRKGSYFCAGTGGSISGNPAGLLILDDPLKGADQAFSPVFRDRAWTWYNMDFKARRSNENVPIILIQTRWHEDDLGGRLLEENLDGWDILSLPAIKTEETNYDYDVRQNGEALWEDRFSIETLQLEKKTMGSYKFSALYQQTPKQEDGNGFKRENFKYYKIITNGKSLYKLQGSNEYTFIDMHDLTVFCTMDLATDIKKSSDFTVICTWGLDKNSNLLLLDMTRKRMVSADHLDLVWSVYKRWRPQVIYIESVQYQISLVQQALKQGLPAKRLESRNDKKTRALSIMAKFESHKVFLNEDAEFTGLIEDELLVFPNGKHDDIVDCFAYAGIQCTNISEIVLPKQKSNIYNTNTRRSELKSLLNNY